MPRWSSGYIYTDFSIISAKSAGIISSLKRASGSLIGGKSDPLTLASFGLRYVTEMHDCEGLEAVADLQ